MVEDRINGLALMQIHTEIEPDIADVIKHSVHLVHVVWPSYGSCYAMHSRKIYFSAWTHCDLYPCWATW